MRLCSRALCLFLLSVPSLAAQQTVHLSGELSRGREFRKQISPTLVFVLAPDEGNGWTIAIEPQQNPKDPDCDDFVAVATPPYHGANARFLDTAYGISAAEAVKQSRREFSFVANCEGKRREEHWLERVLDPGGFTGHELQEGYAKLGASPVGTGVLVILDSRISPAKETVNGANLGQIDWIKFEVTLVLPKTA